MTDPRQFIGSLPGGPVATSGRRYTFASVDPSIFSAATRLNYLFTPDLSLELYMEPFSANARYESFGQLRAPRDGELDHLGEGRLVSRDGRQSFVTGDDTNGDGQPDPVR